MASASSDRIVVSMVSGSAIVHPLVLHTVTIDLRFIQDQSLPKTVDPVGEDGVRSPAFVSARAKAYPTSNINSRIPRALQKPHH